MMCARDGVFFGGDSAFGPKNIIWAVEHGHQAAISIHKYCQGEDLRDRLPIGLNLSSQKMGMHEWSYLERLRPASRATHAARRSQEALQETQYRSRARLHRRAGHRRKLSAA